MQIPQDFFNTVSTQLHQKLPFVIYKKPKTKSLIKGFLQFDNQLHIINKFNESGFVFAPFNDEEDAVLYPLEFSKIIETSIEEFDTFSNSKTSVQSQNDLDNKSSHVELVKNGIEAIKSNLFQKVVLSRKDEIEIEHKDPIQIFKKLVENYPTAFVYLWFHPKVGLWLGATPETLLTIERNTFETMALAGTQKFNGNLDVEWGEKEQQEQQYVTDSIYNSLKEVGIEELKKSNAYTAKAGSLLHIKTDISGNISSNSHDLDKLIKAIHPTPAVCGLPKEAAKKFILENETYNREFYTGFMGELNFTNERKRSSNKRNQENQAYTSITKSTALYVNLRCMKLEGEIAHIYVGGGITKDSEPNLEWEETKNKAETIKAVL